MENFRDKNIDTKNSDMSLEQLNAQLKEALAEQKRLPESTNARFRVLMLQQQIEKFKKNKHE